MGAVLVHRIGRLRPVVPICTLLVRLKETLPAIVEAGSQLPAIGEVHHWGGDL